MASEIANAYPIGCSLTSLDKQPPEGYTVKDATGNIWHNSGDYPCAWMDEIEVETWLKIAGNYGPVVVIDNGD